eukprot:CAMPEP_0202898948 /NCGR_PEP_ID=MMETSP1392-20130828/7331_1 /ASSEMBLY_ACC=CAM_ASM_000868 /TAXON_ID=225041 /ORGANISM="Chlamydomonas chlamydogama, Strain SAG 11-48b" /LENGTH=144 /DNA_ID=CAMNT_0049585019 /DNA_START=110 /DNA_END=544 /DNA_ORIENTATION=-
MSEVDVAPLLPVHQQLQVQVLNVNTLQAEGGAQGAGGGEALAKGPGVTQALELSLHIACREVQSHRRPHRLQVLPQLYCQLQLMLYILAPGRQYNGLAWVRDGGGAFDEDHGGGGQVRRQVQQAWQLLYMVQVVPSYAVHGPIS